MNALGQFGEEFACEELERLGFQILQRGWRANHGEIDIIALDGGCIAFVEVKTRREGYQVRPILAVDYKKRRKLAETAIRYLMEYPEYKAWQPRFDILEVVAQGKPGSYQVVQSEYWKGAFDVYGSV